MPDAIAARQPEAQLRAALASYGATYQTGYGAAGASILERRGALRAGQGAAS